VRWSKKIRQLLFEHCREIVAAADGLSNDVTYIAVSSLGPNVEVDEATGVVGICPSKIKPDWVTVPFQYAVNRVLPGLIFRIKRRSGGA